MTPIRTAYAWLGARVTMMNERGKKDLGEGPVSYIAVILLIAAMVAILIGADIGTKIIDLIKKAIDQVGTKGGITSG